MAKEFQFKRANAARWITINPILKKGEPGIEIETGSTTVKIKYGDGINHWIDLPYFGDGGGGVSHNQLHDLFNIADHTFSGGAVKATIVDADITPVIDSADSGLLKRISFATIKATLKTYFDIIYGTVKSVSLSLPAQFRISGSPVIGTGTLTAVWEDQFAKTVLCAPALLAGTPAFRLLQATDIPVLDYGTVKSVALSLPAQFRVTGSPVIGTGTLTAIWEDEIARTVFAAPTMINGVPSFRLLQASDIPALPYDNYVKWPIEIGALGKRYILKNGGIASGLDYAGIKLIAGTNITISESSVAGGVYGITIEAHSDTKRTRSLATFFTDASNIGSTDTSVYSYTLPANTLIANGDLLELTYGGVGAFNANMKILNFLFGTASSGDFITSTENTAPTEWSMKISMIRISSSVIRYTALCTWGISSVARTSEWVGVNFTINNVIKLILDGTVSGDITAKSGSIILFPAQ